MTSSNREDEEAIDSSGDVVSRGDPSQPKTRKQRRKERERKEAVRLSLRQKLIGDPFWRVLRMTW